MPKNILRVKATSVCMYVHTYVHPSGAFQLHSNLHTSRYISMYIHKYVLLTLLCRIQCNSVVIVDNVW